MNKKIFIIFMASLLNSSPLVKTIASVNNEIITNVDLLITSENLNLDEKKALDYLIKNKIALSIAKKFQITTNSYEIENFLKKMAEKQHMSYDEYINKYKESIDVIKENIKDEVIKEKIINLIGESNKKKVSEDEIVRFYDLNKKNIPNASFEQVKEGIRMHLIEQNINEAINAYLEREESKANIIFY